MQNMWLRKIISLVRIVYFHEACDKWPYLHVVTRARSRSSARHFILLQLRVCSIVEPLLMSSSKNLTE